MPINNCRLIVIEGPDKVGKETQSKMLAKALAQHMLVEREEIPYNDGNTHTKIYDMLKTGEAVKYPVAFQTFQGANRMFWQRERMKGVTYKNDVLILDRWNISAWVYGRASGISDDTLECILREIVEPDIVFIFDGQPFHTPDREDDTYEKNNAFMAKVREQYQRWSEENPEIAVKIDASRPPEVVHKELLWHCKKLLPSVLFSR